MDKEVDVPSIMKRQGDNADNFIGISLPLGENVPCMASPSVQLMSVNGINSNTSTHIPATLVS